MSERQRNELTTPPCSRAVAVVEWYRGDRRASKLIAAAGLGLTGYGARERIEISFKPGEVVDESRVIAAVNKMIEMADAENAPFVIFSPRVISISNVEIRRERSELS